jgi:hypothetical protein
MIKQESADTEPGRGTPFYDWGETSATTSTIFTNILDVVVFFLFLFLFCDTRVFINQGEEGGQSQDLRRMNN